MIIYPIGFLLTLIFFKFFGKRMGFDFDVVNEEDRWPDDWNSNAEAFTFFSLLWLVIIPLLLIFGTFKLLFNFGEWFIKY
jgi:hypothetical protein